MAPFKIRTGFDLGTGLADLPVELPQKKADPPQYRVMPADRELPIDLVPLRMVCERTGKKPRYYCDLRDAGKIALVKIGRRLFMTRSDYDLLITHGVRSKK